MIEHGEAIEYELLAVGRHIDQLGTKRLTWRDLKVVVMCAPPKGALHRAVDPKGWGWDPNTYLLAAQVDLIAAGNWQRGGDKRAARPTPIPRPGEAVKKRKGRNLTAAALNQGT